MRAAAACLAGLAAVAAAPERATAGGNARSITDGDPVTGDWAVVAIVVEGHEICTGTLIARRVVLTAAHCVTDRATKVMFGSSAADGGATFVDVVAMWRHPQFEPATLRHDAGLALLAEDAPDIAEPVPLSTRSFDDDIVGTPIRLVGFGHAYGDGGGEHRKREGWSSLDSYDEHSFRFSPSPSQTCIGDSGGPAFAEVDGVETLIGIASHGDPTCTEFAVDTRVDVYVAGFMAPYVARLAPGTAQVGDRCFYRDHCAGAQCVTAPDDPRLRYCTGGCESDADCPVTMTCSGAGDGSTCRYPVPTPGTFGTSCAGALDCASAQCFEPGQTGVCTELCGPRTGASCPSGFECREPDATCSPTGGCHAGGGAPAPGDGIALLCVIAVLLRAKRRAG